MEDSISQDDGGLQFLLSMLENNDPEFLSTNEFDDFLANLHALKALIWSTAENPVLWKWVIIAAHTTLQSLAVCKLTRSDGFGAMHRNTEAKINQFYADGKNTFDNDDDFTALAAEDHVASFPVLMARMGYAVPDWKDIHGASDPTLKALSWLHRFRSTYIHYPPIQMTLEVSQVIKIVKIAVNVVSLEIEKGNWKRRPLITLDEVTPVLDSIRGRLQEVANE